MYLTRQWEITHSSRTLLTLINYIRRNQNVALKQSNKAERKEKKPVSGNAVDKKDLHPGGRKFNFFNQFSGDILFSSLVSFAFFVFLFCFVFFACFLKLKIYILLHIRLCERVSDKKIYTPPVSGNKTIFLA